MNIFVLDKTPRLAAQYHCDKHVVKMVLETAQILSTVLGGPYKPTHKNHPCVLWAENPTNMTWLFHLGLSLGREYTYRYGKKHKSHTVLEQLTPMISPFAPRPKEFALCMPDYCKVEDDAVASYRNYYAKEKYGILSYTRRSVPDWLQSSPPHGILNTPTAGQQEERV